MNDIVVLPRSNDVAGVPPDVSELLIGEIAVNTADGNIYLKTSLNGGTILPIGNGQLKSLTTVDLNGEYTGFILEGNKGNFGSFGSESINLSFNPSSIIGVGAIGERSFATGDTTTASGLNSSSFGTHTLALGDNMMVIGSWNTGELFNIFEVGMGIDALGRKNAFEVSVDGIVSAPNMSIIDIDTKGAPALITLDYLNSKFFGKISVKIDLVYEPLLNTNDRHYITINQANGIIQLPVDLTTAVIGNFGKFILIQTDIPFAGTSFSSDFIFPGGTSPVIDAVAGEVHVIEYEVIPDPTLTNPYLVICNLTYTIQSIPPAPPPPPPPPPPTGTIQ